MNSEQEETETTESKPFWLFLGAIKWFAIGVFIGTVIDLASLLFAGGRNPTATLDRRETELPVHDPLADAKQSARILTEIVLPTLLNACH